jgi:hypothetical protein
MRMRCGAISRRLAATTFGVGPSRPAHGSDFDKAAVCDYRGPRSFGSSDSIAPPTVSLWIASDEKARARVTARTDPPSRAWLAFPRRTRSEKGLHGRCDHERSPDARAPDPGDRGRDGAAERCPGGAWRGARSASAGAERAALGRAASTQDRSAGAAPRAAPRPPRAEPGREAGGDREGDRDDAGQRPERPAEGATGQGCAEEARRWVRVGGSRRGAIAGAGGGVEEILDRTGDGKPGCRYVETLASRIVEVEGA